MDIVITLIKVIHIVVSLLLVVTVLLQPGKGGDLGSMFGGTTESIFGASGAVPFLTKVTRVLAVLFMVTSLSLGYFSTRRVDSSVIKERAPVSSEEKSAAPPSEENTSEVPPPSSEKTQGQTSNQEQSQEQPLKPKNK